MNVPKGPPADMIGARDFDQMTMSAVEEARRILHDLESHWISLLLWLSEQTSTPPDQLVAGLEKGERAIYNFGVEANRLGTVAVPFTPIHFVDFADYNKIAAQYRAELERLGAPPKGWRGVLAGEIDQGLVRFRNHLAHGNRFALLPQGERQRAVELFRAQREHLRQWWPNCPFRPQEVRSEPSPLRTALRLLDHEAADAGALVEELGMSAIRNPLNLIPPGAETPLAGALEGHASRLFRVGEAQVGSGTVGMYLVYLDQWPEQASQREKDRRRVARALVEHQATDARWLAVLLDQNGNADEVELILPRVRDKGGVGTVRATINPSHPSRYHIELLDSLRVPAGISLPALSRKWGDAFSVERVTKRFYEEFSGLRDRLIAALLESNPDNPALVDKDRSDPAFALQLNAFATRQLSRVLFLWFLQQKRWLGDHPGAGSVTYLVDLFRTNAGADTYYSDVLVPIFFDGLGLPVGEVDHAAVERRFGELPYLDGGLFRADADEFECALFGIDRDGQRTRAVHLPDDLFDPAKDERTVATGRRVTTRARTVLGLLLGYRFTTQESTPDDQSVDPDPELLGRVFENLYQADERHQTGAYYTPREIVRYMCRQALDGYLRDRASVPQETIDWLRQEAIEWEATNRRLDRGDADRLRRALDDVTVLDPAVGSGAFLVGALQEIVLLRRGIEQAERDTDVERSSQAVADWKLHAITHSLYGVDINPMAVEICRLRLWLSLVIDLDVVLASQIPPLPNLDFRIVAGDSLVDRMGAERFVQSLPFDHVQLDMDMEQRQREIDGWQRRFEDAGRRGHADTMRSLAARIHAARLDIARLQVDAAIKRAETAKTRLASGRSTARALAAADSQTAALTQVRSRLTADAPFQKPLLWPLTFPQVFANGAPGFDIVLANPPYVRQEHLDPVDQEAYRHAFPEVYAGTADLLVFFFARALQVLRPGGHLAFITSNKYMRAAYGAGLREYLPANLQLARVIDFGDLPLFDVAAYPAVVVGKKVAAPALESPVSVSDLVYPIRRALATQERPVNPDGVRLTLEGLPDLLSAAEVPAYPQVLLRRDGWILEDPVLVRLFDRLMNQGIPLGKYVEGRMYYGIKTGLNDAFVIDQAKRNELVTADPRSAELIKPWLRGRDIKRWHADWAGLHVIFARHGTPIDRYPAIRDHLSQWREDLEPRKLGSSAQGKGRKPGNYRWYEIQDNVAYYEEFDQPKVIMPHFLAWAAFAYDESGACHNNAATFCIAPRPGVAALLNSNLGWFILSTMGTALQNGYTQLFVQFFERLPVPKSLLPNHPEASALDKIVLQWSSDRFSNVDGESEVERLVAALYGLTHQERHALDTWAVRKRRVVPELSIYRSEIN